MRWEGLKLHWKDSVALVLAILDYTRKLDWFVLRSYRPPEGGRLHDIEVVSGYAFLRTYYVYNKKITANHAAAISHKH